MTLTQSPPPPNYDYNYNVVHGGVYFHIFRSYAQCHAVQYGVHDLDSCAHKGCQYPQNYFNFFTVQYTR